MTSRSPVDSKLNYSIQTLHHNVPGTFLFHRRPDFVLASIITFLCSKFSQFVQNITIPEYVKKICNAIINNVTRTFSDRFLNIISTRSNNVLVTLLTRQFVMCSITFCERYANVRAIGNDRSVFGQILPISCYTVYMLT